MEDAKQQLDVIKEILAERTKFHALSGISGVLAGIYALIGSFYTYTIIADYNVTDQRGDEVVLINKILTVSLLVLFSSLGTGWYSSYKKSQGRLFSSAGKLLMKELMLFLTVGGLVILSCIKYKFLLIISPLSLIFYGLTLIHVSNLLYNEIRQLGLIVILLGLVGLFLPQHGLLIWAFGFGVMHIIYGFVMWVKYER